AANSRRILSLDGFGGLAGQIEIPTSRGQKRAQAETIGNQLGRPAIINRPFAGREANQKMAIVMLAQGREPERMVDHSKTGLTRDNTHSVYQHLGLAQRAEPRRENAPEKGSARTKRVNAAGLFQNLRRFSRNILIQLLSEPSSDREQRRPRALNRPRSLARNGMPRGPRVVVVSRVHQLQPVRGRRPLPRMGSPA